MITHIIVGDKHWTPTQEDLDKILARFKTEKVFINQPNVKVLLADYQASTPGNEALDSNTTVVVTAGDKDWNPTQEELDIIRSHFEAALTVQDSIVVTRHSVRAEIIHRSIFGGRLRIKFS